MIKKYNNLKIQSLNDLVCRSEKNEVLIPWCSKRIVHMAVEKQMYDVVHHFSSFLTSNPYQLAQSNGEHIAESYFGMKYDSKVVCAHGYDLDNGIDVKTALVREGATSAHIGNTSVKQHLAILLIHENGEIIETKTAIPVPGDENTISIPLTDNFKIWDGYEHAGCFYPKDVEADPDRFIHGKWADRGILNVYRVDDAKGQRFRLRCLRDSFDKVKEGSFDLLAFAFDDEELPVFLNDRYFDNTFSRRFETTIPLEGHVVKPNAKHVMLFPKFMIHGMLDLTQSLEFNAAFLDGTINSNNIDTLNRILNDKLIAMKFE